MNDKNLMNKAADNIRILAASAVEKAKSGHPGGAMGGADFINVLYSEYLKYDPQNPEWVGRDRFFLDPGHMAPMLYSQLTLIGKFTLDELAQLRQWGSPTTGHPEFEIARGIENTSGPLGQGHVFAVGAAIAAKFLAAHTGNPTFDKENYELRTGSFKPNTLYRVKLRGTCKEVVDGREVDPIYKDSLSGYKEEHRPFGRCFRCWCRILAYLSKCVIMDKKVERSGQHGKAKDIPWAFSEIYCQLLFKFGGGGGRFFASNLAAGQFFDGLRIGFGAHGNGAIGIQSYEFLYQQKAGVSQPAACGSGAAALFSPGDPSGGAAGAADLWAECSAGDR